MKSHMFDVTIVYAVGDETKTVHLQYKTKEEADIVARLHPVGAKEKLDDNGSMGIVRDVWVGETLVEIKE